MKRREHFQTHLLCQHYPERKHKQETSQEEKIHKKDNIPDEYRCKNSQQNDDNLIQQHIKRIIHQY